jgi:hypothetical protein
VLRLSLVFATVVAAVAIPNVQQLIGLAGAVAGATTALIVPPVLALKYLAEDGASARKKLVEYFFLSLVVIFGFLGAVASLYDIYKTLVGE